nr:uncharacterized protein LOC110377288 [Helicoverpa armigera]XP_021191787.2 uncharacterized protein LOC110377288 [Helicoverpa armigera]
MIVLTGSNLGERQRELNEKVKEAADKDVDFDQIKDTTEESDVDKLFKIDLASKYGNIEYIIEVLKSGDSLYISRALKCSWLYGEDFAKFINADYLHKNVVPYLSSKMKKKLLTAISMHVRNETRAESFYKYCMDNKYTGIALKFLNFTSESFKLDVLKDDTKCNRMISDCGSEYLKNFIGVSFTLAEAYVATFPETARMPAFAGLSYLYTVSDDKYLDLLEKSVVLNPYNTTILGLRISKSIMKHHKDDRVLSKPSLYVRIIHKTAIVKYSTAEDAKKYAAAVLPENVENFWNQNYCSKYKFILDKIQDGKFEFVKQIFTAKYPGEAFETHLNFYQKQFYKIMTTEEKETWALQQIASGSEILGIGKDYNWYKFISFEKAFEEIKKLVLVTPDYIKRADMMLILVDSAKTQRDLAKLLKHYYERHANEQKYIKENFLDRVMQNFNVFEFNDDCWSAWNKLFYNLDVYSLTVYSSKSEYKIIALIYHIINHIDIPEAITTHINSEMQFYALKLNTDKLKKEEVEMVFQYLFEFYMTEIKKFENVPYSDDVKYRLRRYIHFILDLLDQYDRTKEDCPELVNQFMKKDWDEFSCHRLLREPKKCQVTRVDLLRLLKKDASLLVKHLPEVQDNIDNSFKYDISTVLKKLKIYFSNDIAKDYLKFFNDILAAEDRLWLKEAHAAVHGIFQLGDENLKVDFMKKYAPTEAVINHSEIDEKLLRIQQAICSHACYSRPPVPLQSVLMYIKGDYVHFCLPMFHSYLANLPLPLCIEFVEAILNTPVSIQKHGIRLAFECFSEENLNTLVLRAWKKTKNVSLRLIIFKALHAKILKESNTQGILFDTLKTIALTLGQDDDDEIFRLLISRQWPEPMKLECIDIAWKVVSQFPPKQANLARMRLVINCMSNNINIIRSDSICGIIDTFMSTVFKQEEEEEGNGKKQSAEAIALIDAKWELTAAYIINIKDINDLSKKIEVAKHILNKCLRSQESGARQNRQDLLKTCMTFVNSMEFRCYDQEISRYENVNTMMQFVLKTLYDSLPLEEIYIEIWELRLGMLVRNVLMAHKKLVGQEQINKDAIKVIVMSFAKELSNLIKELIDTGLYFNSFLSDIQSKILNKMKTVKVKFDIKIKFCNMISTLCLGLMTFGIPEMYLLVVNLLPDSCNPELDEDYRSVVTKLYNVENKEIRCNLYRKLNKSDYKVLDIIGQ